MPKITIKASSDVALVKYWGKKDQSVRLPENGSVSMILQGLDTVTTVEWQPSLVKDEITIQGTQDKTETQRVVAQLDRIRKQCNINLFAKVVSENTFPKGTGLSSSGSGFAALTYAATLAADLHLTEKELSILARQGSGTACRCVCGGFVEWKDGQSSETSYSETLFTPDHWDIRDVVVVVDEGKKKISSTEGHALARSSIFFEVRQRNIPTKILHVKQALTQKNFEQLGNLIEAEALEFHSILLTSQPPLVMWYPGTMQVIHEVHQLRLEGIPAYFTINTGFNVHVLTQPNYEKIVQQRLAALPLVTKTLLAKVGAAPYQIDDHLF
jgi:diphosphomevalonate decarboxylase